MPLQLIFWILMFAWLGFGFVLWPYKAGDTAVAKAWGGHIIIWILLLCIGWRVFGPAVRG